MLRGIVIWTAFCLSLVVLWRLADFTSGRERLLQENYAMEASVTAQPADHQNFGAAARPVPKWHRCEYEPIDCDDFRCDRRQVGMYSKYQ